MCEVVVLQFCYFHHALWIVLFAFNYVFFKMIFTQHWQCNLVYVTAWKQAFLAVWRSSCLSLHHDSEVHLILPKNCPDTWQSGTSGSWQCFIKSEEEQLLLQDETFHIYYHVYINQTWDEKWQKEMLKSGRLWKTFIILLSSKQFHKKDQEVLVCCNAHLIFLIGVTMTAYWGL